MRGRRGRGRGGRRSRLPPLNDGGGKSDKKKLERRGMDSDFQAPVTYPARNALEYMQISPEDLKVTEAMRKLDEEMEKSGYRIPGTSYDTLLRDRLENLNALHGKKSNGVRKSLMEELPSLSPSIFPAELIRGLKLKKKKNAYEEEGSGFMSSDFISHSLAAVGDEEDTQLNKDDERIYDDKADEGDEGGDDYNAMRFIGAETGGDDDGDAFGADDDEILL